MHHAPPAVFARRQKQRGAERKGACAEGHNTHTIQVVRPSKGRRLLQAASTRGKSMRRLVSTQGGAGLGASYCQMAPTFSQCLWDRAHAALGVSNPPIEPVGQDLSAQRARKKHLRRARWWCLLWQLHCRVCPSPVPPVPLAPSQHSHPPTAGVEG